MTEDQKTAYEMYRDGKTPYQIGKFMGTSEDEAKQLLRDLNLAISGEYDRHTLAQHRHKIEDTLAARELNTLLDPLQGL